MLSVKYAVGLFCAAMGITAPSSVIIAESRFLSLRFLILRDRFAARIVPPWNQNGLRILMAGRLETGRNVWIDKHGKPGVRSWYPAAGAGGSENNIVHSQRCG